ncbi:hypothetical protein EEJ42_43965 [Streptomyces botrytidirepellens]|uniref:Uncharacterized protein n=1 Tax=Streptomyces botrytidirepellens TaxID=2486417 RepID=A0A3M8STQ8_9ACTN|nr:hypothetical protein EEJ42_43965 [Streptomyces botrytidirepellens]
MAVCSRSGEVRWVYRHDAWSEGGMGCGACAADPSGRYLFATTPGHLDPGRPYEGDLCVALDLATGKLVAEAVLPSFSAMYSLQHSLAVNEGVVFLTAGQGQDEAYSLLVSLSDGEVVVRQAGVVDEPFTGNSLAPGVFLKQAIDGEDLTRYEDGLPVATTSAETILSAEMRFVGRPGFLDDARILAAVAEEAWEGEARHFLLDARTLEVVAEIDYPASASLDPLALGDGTWLTVEGDEVSRWRIS